MYSFQSRVRYSEINHQHEAMQCSSIINYFQDCSTFQSEDLNRGLSYLQTKHKVWLLNSWQLNILSPARLGDLITVGTWAYNFKGFYGYRNFIMKDEQDKVLAVANSLWVYVDTETGKPSRIPDNPGYELEPPYPMEYAPRKVEFPDNFETLPSFHVKKSNIDSYNHVNNGQYITMAEEYLPDTFFVKQMRVEYRTQALLGDIIYPLLSKEDDCIKIVLAHEDHSPYAIVEFRSDIR